MGKRAVTGVVLLAAACAAPAAPHRPERLAFRFQVGDVRSYRVESEWSVDMTGSEAFRFQWSRERDGRVPETASLDRSMDKFVASMIDPPMKLVVNSKGFIHTQPSELNRLVMRQGVAYWPIGRQGTSWNSTDAITVPLLHERLNLAFANSITEISGRTVRWRARASLVQKVDDYGVSREAEAEFDTVRGGLG